MTAYVGLIPDSTERNADVLSVHRTGDRCAEGGFSHAGRTVQTEYLVFKLRIELLYAQVFADAVLDLFKSVMIGIKNLSRVLHIDPVGALGEPRYFKAGVDVIADDRCFRRTEGGLCKARYFLVQLFAHLVGRAASPTFAVYSSISSSESIPSSFWITLSCSRR